jgi:DNA topoisomerase I
MSTSTLAMNPKVSAKAAGLLYVNDQGPGIARRRRGKGFVYIGVDQKPVRNKRTLARIRSLVIPPAWESVWICPIENGHIQAVGRDARKRKQYRYHPRYREVRDETKFDRMGAFGAVLPKIRRQVKKDLSLPGLQQRKVMAAIIYLLDKTCIRVGNEEYAKSNKSYGLTTLKDKHVDVHGDSVHLHFRGKSKQDHDITLSDRRLAKIVKQCQDLPGQELFQYKAENGEYVKVDSAEVNDYLRGITQEDFSAKDFRTWHGTGQMAQQLAALGPAQSDTEAKRNIAQAVKETAKHLGNRPAACRKYYIHPAVFDSYVERTIFPAMQKIQSGSAKRVSGLRPVEVAVLRLVQPRMRRRKDEQMKVS